MVPLYQAKAEFFRTLGHPARIRVLELLSDRDHAVHELLERVDIEASNLSQQLAVLRRAGLVAQRREAGSVVYSISVPEVRDLLMAARRDTVPTPDAPTGVRSLVARAWRPTRALLPRTADLDAARRQPRRDLLAG